VDERFQNDRPIDEQQPPNTASVPASVRIAILAFALMLPLMVRIALRPADARAAWEQIASIIQLKSDPLPASPAKFSEHLNEGLSSRAPQGQAELLLEESINHYDGAIEKLSGRMDSFRGQLTLSPRLASLLDTALNSNDLRVRAAGIEVELAVYDLPKSRESAQGLIQRIESDPAARPWALWMLGAIGNRGVEAGPALDTLLRYARDPDEKTRHWAVEGLSLLGSGATIEPLLEIFRNDSSMQVRERAACGLAQSGMLTKEQRLTAVPTLLNYTEDPAFDSTARTWVYQALRDITGGTVANNPTAWRQWWMENASR
jgi:hypothetical protein